MKQAVPFLFACCQVGSEAFLKRELAKRFANLSLAFSRPGFVTFKVHSPEGWDMQQPLHAVFARSWGASLGAVRSAEELVGQLPERLPQLPFRHLHVWTRDRDVPGERDFEPLPSPASRELGLELKSQPASPCAPAAVNRTARVGDFVVDVIEVDPQCWFIGWHQAAAVPSRWPGGVPPLKPPESMVSRAYLKMVEALRWSQLPIGPGELCVELGSSPGGSCQALLDRHCRVVGIDPAEMHEQLLAHPEFTHIRARAADLKRKEFAEVRWLMADANIAPSDSLQAIEDIVTHRRVHIRGLLITLKLLDETMVEQIDSYLARIRSWGYGFVRARQLAFNRREICVMAVPSKHHLRRRWRKAARSA